MMITKEPKTFDFKVTMFDSSGSQTISSDDPAHVAGMVRFMQNNFPDMDCEVEEWSNELGGYIESSIERLEAIA